MKLTPGRRSRRGLLLFSKIQQQFQSPPTAIVAENGGLIAYPNDAQYNISVSSVDIKAILKVAHELRRKNNYLFTGFSDMTPEEVSSATGLELKAASLAKQRNATEPLLWYDSQEKLIEFKKSLKDAGIRIVLGGQFIHLMGQADKADALQQLRAYYIKKHPSHHWLIVALGDSPNDQIMLNKADLGIQIPNKKRPPFNLSTTHSIQCTEYGPAGWQQGIREILQSFYGIQF